jgi:hypothetical protein
VSATDLRLSPSPARASASAPDHRDDRPAVVTVSRTHRTDAQQRQVLVRFDDGPTDTLMFGDERTREISAGQHVLHANNTLVWKRLAFAVEAGEHADFEIINRPGRLTLGFLALLGVAPLYLSIEKKGVTKSP